MERIKAINPIITARKVSEEPYYEIIYYDVSDNMWHTGFGSYNFDFVQEWLNEYFDAVESDVHPVKHGKWKHFGSGLNMPLYCSRCEKTFPEYFKKFDFCPNYGARMYGKDDE